MSIDLSQFIPSFLEESFDGLAIMEDKLLTLETADKETINTIFRAAHSIKGGAGTFGFQRITDFTHLVETLLDEMRDGRREITTEDKELLLRAVDCIRSLLEAARDETDVDEAMIDDVTTQLTHCLDNKDDESLNTSPRPKLDDGEEPSAITAGSVDTLQTPQWQIDFIPEHHLVQTGNDPLLLFYALADLGELTVVANLDSLPPLEDMDPQELYLSWRLTLTTTHDEAAIREVFEWIEDDCELTIQLMNQVTENQSNKNSLSEASDGNEVNTNQATSIIHTEQHNQPNNDEQQIAPSAPISNDQKSPHKPTPDLLHQENTSVVKSKETSSIRVSVDKVDQLINLVGELVITQSMLSELGQDFSMDKLEHLHAGLDQLLQNTKELQESVMQIRMLPISFAFNRFPRMIHDYCQKSGKQIELILKGEQTELDKTVMEQIGDPLMHLVRNAADHGIELPEQRLDQGKSEQGTITLYAYHQGGNIVVEIQDDGRGIDTQAVYNKAIEKQLIEAGTTLTEQQIYDLLFEPGFSTAEQVSDISGRGVGMDVVKKNIQALGGRIHVQSTAGKGSTFKVFLPLTLAIVDGQLVRVESEVYVIPLISIVESLQPDKQRLTVVSGDVLIYRLRDENVPVISLSQLFNISHQAVDINNALFVVVESAGQKVALVVDDLLAQQQVVIKSLSENYQEVAGISGATILGNGSVALILDIAGIIQQARLDTQAKHQASEQVT
jgi:two-component system chemotaxis sensor kinase CheA